MGTQRRIIKMIGTTHYENFEIEEINFYRCRTGRGPYRLKYNGKEIFSAQRHGECRDQLEAIIRDKWALERQIHELKQSYLKKWGLISYPA